MPKRRTRPKEPRRVIAWYAPLRLVYVLAGMAKREGVSVSGILEAVIVVGLKNLGERVPDVPGLLPPEMDPGMFGSRRPPPIPTEKKQEWQARGKAAWEGLLERGIPIAHVARQSKTGYRTALRALHGVIANQSATEAAEEMVREWDVAVPERKLWPGTNPRGGRPRKSPRKEEPP